MIDATPHLWQGEWIDDAEAGRRLESLPEAVQATISTPLRSVVVLAACERLGEALISGRAPAFERLAGYLRSTGMAAAEAGVLLHEIGVFLGREGLETKLKREFGTVDPARFGRINFRETVFEAWAPLGLLVHVLPTNAASVGPLSVVEGLLAGNFNAAKVGGGDTLFTQHLLSELGDMDPTGEISRRIIVLRFASSRTAWLEMLCTEADGIAAWGGEEALAGVRHLVPPGCRLVDWGHKISFAYLTRDASEEDATLAAVARDVCLMDQQACSSPQVAYLDTEDIDDVYAFAERFAPVLAKVGRDFPAPPALDIQEQAEITNTVLVARLEEHLDLTRVYEAPDLSWRLLVDKRPALRASPLFRTLWLKPLPREEIVATLRPMRRYLQTVGLGCGRADAAELTQAVTAAGALRVMPPGEMLDSYEGEPHDGVYALQRYSRRVSAQLDKRFANDAALDDLVVTPQLMPPPGTPIMTKKEFQAQEIDPSYAKLFFKSGGSSGEPKLSVFTYEDYQDQMRRAAEGLLAAGLDPNTDHAMNLFFGGGLYGGFLSVFSLLENLRAVQFPMAAHPDHGMVARTIADHGVDTLLGMPSYLLQVFENGADVLRRYRGVRKVFYGGEHLGERRRRWLREEFGVEMVRSAGYGSVDAGPLGFQCEYAEGTVHHLLMGLQTLEILALEEDRPTSPGEAGRLVFTSHVRHGQHLERYEIGDLGRWVPGECACGRRTPRFELLGRFGDVVRIGAAFLNYRRFAAIAEERLGYAGEVQIVLTDDGAREALAVRLDPAMLDDGAGRDAEHAFLEDYPDLKEAVEEDRVLDFVVEAVPEAALERTPGSGKLRAVIDRRSSVAGAPR